MNDLIRTKYHPKLQLKMHKYHEFIESNYKTFDVGKYEYKSAFLKKVKTARVELPVDMHKQGLLILGSQESFRRQFTYHYAKTLLAAGKKVLFITDALTESQYHTEEYTQLFHDHLGTKDMAVSAIHYGSLTGEYDCDILNEEASLFVIKTNTGEKMMNAALYKEYDSNLLKLLEGVADARHQDKVNGTSNWNDEKLVIFLDEDCYSSVLDYEILENLCRQFSRLGVGVVVSSFESRRYRGALNSINHHAFFQILDPTMVTDEISAFNRRSIDWQHISAKHKYKIHLDSRDLKSLAPRDFWYFQSNLVGFSNLTTFDVTG